MTIRFARALMLPKLRTASAARYRWRGSQWLCLFTVWLLVLVSSAFATSSQAIQGTSLAECTAGNNNGSTPSAKRVLLTSLGLLGHAVPLMRLGAELAHLCCLQTERPVCVVDVASNSEAWAWWVEEVITVKDSPCLGKFIDMGPLPSGWSKKLNVISKDPSLFRSTLSVFSDLYLEALPNFYSSIQGVLAGTSLAVIDVGTLGALEAARAMDIPVIIHSATIWADAFAQFEPPHWLPAFGSGFTKEMTLAERCLNALLPRLLSVALQPALMRVNRMRFDTKRDPYQSSHQVFQDVQTISSTALGFEYTRLAPSLHTYVGPMLPRRANRTNIFSVHIKAFLKQCISENRIRLVIARFGSMIPLGRRRTRSIHRALRWLSTKENICVVWFPSSSLSRNLSHSLPKRISTKSFYFVKDFSVDQYMTILRTASRLQEIPSKWATTVLSLSTCGMAAVQEPLYHGIPVFCVPLVADQADVAARLVDSGAGLVLGKSEVTSGKVLLALNQLLNDKTFKVNAEAMGALFRMAGGRQRAALQVFSAFYPQTHLLLNKSLSWHKRIGLDVSIVFGSVFIIFAMTFLLYARKIRNQRYGF